MRAAENLGRFKLTITVSLDLTDSDPSRGSDPFQRPGVAYPPCGSWPIGQ